MKIGLRVFCVWTYVLSVFYAMNTIEGVARIYGVGARGTDSLGWPFVHYEWGDFRPWLLAANIAIALAAAIVIGLVIDGMLKWTASDEPEEFSNWQTEDAPQVPS